MDSRKREGGEGSGRRERGKKEQGWEGLQYLSPYECQYISDIVRTYPEGGMDGDWKKGKWRGPGGKMGRPTVPSSTGGRGYFQHSPSLPPSLRREGGRYRGREGLLYLHPHEGEDVPNIVRRYRPFLVREPVETTLQNLDLIRFKAYIDR